MTGGFDTTRVARALTRAPADSAVDGLRAVDRGAPDIAGLQAEHAAYVAALKALGVAVEVLPPLPAFPDAQFVEDPALLLPGGVAALLRPGAASRAGEAAELAPALALWEGELLPLPGEGCVDGGDVLVMPEAILIGLSERTDPTGAGALAGLLGSLGYRAEIVTPPPGVLHLKSACGLVDAETVLATPTLAAASVLPTSLSVIETAPEEDAAANALAVNGVVLLSDAYPRTHERLSARGYACRPLRLMETEKLDAGLSCLSLRSPT